jgi:predicted DNA-binding transcriptional regulator AlpA
MITITEETVRELVHAEVAKRIELLEPLVREELAKRCALVTAEEGIAMLSIKGKEPRRTFLRLMNRYQVPKVVIGAAVKGWKRSGIEKLVDDHTSPKPKAETLKFAA